MNFNNQKYHFFRIESATALQIYQLLKFGMLLLVNILLVKLGLSVEEISQYELFLFWSAAAGWFWLDAIIRVMLIRNSDNNSDSLAILLLLSILASIFVFYIFRNHTNAYLLSLYILFSYPANLVEYLLFLRRKTKVLLAYAIISNGAYISIILLCITLQYSINQIFIGLIIFSLLKFGYTLWLLQKTAITLHFENWKAIAKLGLPLAGVSLLAGAAPYFDGWLVTRYFDSETFAIFRYGAKELPIIAIIANTFSNSMLPNFSKQPVSEILTEIKRKSAKLMHLFFPLTIVLILSSKWIFPLIFSTSFSLSASIFAIYMLLTASRLVFPQTILSGLKNTKSMFYASIFELLINIVFSFIFMHYFGMQGIAAATVMAFYSEKIILIGLLHFKYKIKAADYINLNLLITYSLVMFAVYFIQFAF